jgi:hypothetical protein
VSLPGKLTAEKKILSHSRTFSLSRIEYGEKKNTAENLSAQLTHITLKMYIFPQGFFFSAVPCSLFSQFQSVRVLVFTIEVVNVRQCSVQSDLQLEKKE